MTKDIVRQQNSGCVTCPNVLDREVNLPLGSPAARLFARKQGIPVRKESVSTRCKSKSHWTYIWLLACVRPHVCCELRVLGEHLWAVVALFILLHLRTAEILGLK